jgi:hypothetical protein
MTEETNETSVERRRGSGVAIAAIIVVGIVMLACIFAATGIVISFINNAPW